MAKNQKSFGAASGLFSNKKEDAQVASIKSSNTQELKNDNNAEVVKNETNSALSKTQGRKGQKLPRINMAFTPENHIYIKRTSRQNGMSITEYINNLINQDRDK